jgi:uncharacterized membrane protein
MAIADLVKVTSVRMQAPAGESRGACLPVASTYALLRSALIRAATVLERRAAARSESVLVSPSALLGARADWLFTTDPGRLWWEVAQVWPQNRQFGACICMDW